MKTLITNYSYNAGAKTVTISFATQLVLENILLVTNVTRNQILYNFATSGGTLSNNVLTFTANNPGNANSDRLSIYVEDGVYPVSVDSVAELQSQTILLRRLVKVLESNTVTDAQQRQKIVLDSITPTLTLSTVTTVGTVSTVSSVTTVSTVSSITAFGTGVQLPSLNALNGVPTIENQIQWSRTAYGAATRPNLVFTS